MKKETFTTKRKNELREAQDAFTEFGIWYIKSWTENELKSYRSKPVVIPIGDRGFFVGPYDIEKIYDDCWKVVQQDGQYIHDFTSKITAILYCLNSTKHRYHNAQHLLDLDVRIGKLEMDIKQYEHSIKVLQNNQNWFKSAAVLNRCIDAKMQRRELQKILKKSLISAKYLNFGNQPL